MNKREFAGKMVKTLIGTVALAAAGTITTYAVERIIDNRTENGDRIKIAKAKREIRDNFKVIYNKRDNKVDFVETSEFEKKQEKMHNLTWAEQTAYGELEEECLLTAVNDRRIIFVEEQQKTDLTDKKEEN